MIRSVEIKDFRGIKSGKLDNFTPLTILVGPNGCGKSTILDAIFICVNPNTGSAIARCVQRHSGVTIGARWLQWHATAWDVTQVTVGTTGSDIRRCALFVEDDPNIRRREQAVGFSVTHDDEADTLRGSVRFHRGKASVEPHAKRALAGIEDIRLLEPSTSYLQASLPDLFTKAVEVGRRAEARSAIRSLAQGLQDIEILTEDGSPVVHFVYKDHSVPAALAGDGIHSLLRLSLELITRPHGVVLIEEPELHLHPAAIRETARVIFDSVRNGTQIILTTHSIELIDSLLTEAESDEELGVLSVYRLKLENGLLLSSRFSGMEAAVARSEIEDDLR